MDLDDQPSSTFRPVPRTGVIFVSEEARLRGWAPGHPDWCNLGQGQPETGPLPGAPERIHTIEIDPGDQEYAPVPGLPELREAIAHYYNTVHRRGRASKYTAENVCVSGGGRAALTRAVAALGAVNLGHFLPDYTAYEELLEIFRLVTPIPILLQRERAYDFSTADLEREIRGRGLSALLLSNPANPTGKVLRDGELDSWVDVARRFDCTLLLDEFYSHYVWNGPAPVSAAAYVDDVDRDPVVIFDGLTKNWRYPGWRVTWAVGPKRVVEAMASAGSFLDGGGSKPLQRAAVPLLDPDRVAAEDAAIQAAFAPKRRLTLERLRALGLSHELEPNGTFYVFASLAALPEPLSDGMAFFRAALEHRVITVPGVFFDVNPGRRRSRRHSRFHRHVRISYGPPMDEVLRGLDRLETLLATNK
jgi:aspartate/methionine/tyrosine aminotransferase